MKQIILIVFFGCAWLLFINSCKSTTNTNLTNKRPVIDPSLPADEQKVSEQENSSNIAQTQQSSRNLAEEKDSKPAQTFVNKSPRCNGHSGSAVVLMYHRFGEPYESTSIKLEQFTRHLQFFKDNGFSVVSIETLISAINGDVPFSGKWVVITVDDAYKSFLRVKPALEKFQYPYTIFVNTEAVDQKHSDYMNWRQLKAISQSSLGELAAHTHTHSHLVRGLTPQQRRADILLSVEKIYKNTGTLPRFFSYPYGETSTRLINEVKNLKTLIDGKEFYFLAAFATQSGPAGCSSDLFMLPRFAMNEKYGTIDKLFKTKLNSLHLPVYDEYPSNKSVCLSESLRSLYFSTASSINLSQLRCYANRGNSVTVLAAHQGMVSLKLKNPLGEGVQNPYDVRERINCTMPSDSRNRFFWHGQEFTILNNSDECAP